MVLTNENVSIVRRLFNYLYNLDILFPEYFLYYTVETTFDSHKSYFYQLKTLNMFFGVP